MPKPEATPVAGLTGPRPRITPQFFQRAKKKQDFGTSSFLDP